MSSNKVAGLFTVSSVLRAIGATLLLVALAKMPYEYFSILRVVTCLVSVYMIYVAVSAKRPGWIVPFALIFLLFLPLRLWVIKRELWMVIDVVTAVFFLASIYFVREVPPSQIKK